MKDLSISEPIHMELKITILLFFLFCINFIYLIINLFIYHALHYCFFSRRISFSYVTAKMVRAFVRMSMCLCLCARQRVLIFSNAYARFINLYK